MPSVGQSDFHIVFNPHQPYELELDISMLQVRKRTQLVGHRTGGNLAKFKVSCLNFSASLAPLSHGMTLVHL